MISRKPLNHALYTAFIAGGLTLSASALAQTQGLYSADELTDAEVFSKQQPNEAIGEVEDILLDESMNVNSLVIDTSDILDLGQKQYIIDTSRFTVETLNGDNKDEVEYKITVDMTEEEISQQPEYTNDWWSETKSAAAAAWQNTKQTTSSAWESTKSATSNALDSAGEALNEAGQETEQAADNVAQETEQAADAAANQTQDAVEATGDKVEQAGDEIEQETDN